MSIEVDLDELIYALEDYCSYKNYYLDTETGDVITLSEDSDVVEGDDHREEIEHDESDRFVYIEPVDSTKSFKIMEDFVGNLTESEAKASLVEAINQSRPFRKFKNRLIKHPGIRKKWFAFKENRMKEMALEWLKNNEMEIES